jgi:hypothetical protein
MIALNQQISAISQKGPCPPTWLVGVLVWILAPIVFTASLCFFAAEIAQAETPNANRSNPMLGNSSDAIRLSAIQSLPMEKLNAQDRAKVHAVLANVTVFRRMPVRVIECDPDLYLFVVRHPDVIVSIWNTLKISQIQLEQSAPDRFHLDERYGTVADLEVLYSSHDTHLIYANGAYEGVLFGRPVRGSGLFLLKSSYIRETDGRYYISSRLDAFLSIEPGAVELVTKAVHPLVGKTADNNFIQTVAFVGSLSRTAETNCRGVERLASQLSSVQPDVREQFSKLAEQIAEKPSAVALRRVTESADVARKDDGSTRR